MHPTSYPPPRLAGRFLGLAEIASRIPVGKLYTWTLLFIGASYWGNVLRALPHGEDGHLIWMLNSVLGNGAFNIATWVIIAVRARGIAPTGMASRKQIALAMAIVLMCIVPRTQATVGPLLALGIVLARTSGTRNGQDVAILLLGIAAELIWGSFYMLPFHASVAKLDAQAVAALLSWAGQSVLAHANLVDNVSAQHSIEVLGFCASTFPLSCSPFQAAGAYFPCLSFKLFSVTATGQGRRHDHETTVDHALMRGLVAAGPVMRRGASSV